jgi:predicted ATPase
MSGQQGGQRFARRLFAATGGSPFYLLETLRHLFETGALWIEPGGGWSTPYDEVTEDYAELPLPKSVIAAVSERVDRLGAAPRRLLEAASLAGESFGLELITPATALSDWEALESLEHALAAELLLPSDDAYRFSHDLIRRALLERMSRERRRLIHRRLAEALEHQEGSAAQIAWHLEQAGVLPGAARWYRHAALAAEQLYAQHEALAYYQRALSCGLSAAEAVQVHLQRAEILWELIDHAAFDAELAQAAALAEQLGDSALRFAVRCQELDALAHRGQSAQVLSRLGEALALAASDTQRARVYQVAAAAHLSAGDAAAAEAALRAALALAGEDATVLRGQLHKSLSLCLRQRGDIVAAKAQLEPAAAIFNTLGKKDMLAQVRVFQGVYALWQGDPQESAALLEAALVLARESGALMAQRAALLNLIKHYTDAANLEAALPLIDEGLHLSQNFEHPATEVAFVQAAAYCHYLQGQLGEALTCFQQAIAIADRSVTPEWRANARLTPVDLYLQLDDLPTCHSLLSEARALVDAHQLTHVRPNLEGRQAWLELASGQPEAAVARLTGLIANHPEMPAIDRCAIDRFLALAHLAAGRLPEAARLAAALQQAQLSEVQLHALAISLRVQLALRQDCTAALRTAEATLKQPYLLPLEALGLRRAVLEALACGETTTATRFRAVCRSELECLADSLSTYPALRQNLLAAYQDWL